MAEEEEEGILQSYVSRKSVSNVFLKPQEEGAFNILVNKHLVDEEEKFKSYFRFTREQFSSILNDIKEDLQTDPCNRMMAPISLAEKVAVTLRKIKKIKFIIDHSIL